MFYCGGYAFAHAQSMKEAVHAKTLETLEEAMWKGLCHYPDDGMGEQANGRYSIYKVANGRIAQVVAEGYVPGQAYFQSKPFWVDSPFALNSFYDDFRHLVKNVKAAKLGIRDTPKRRNDEAWQGHWLDICRMSRIATVLLPDDDTANLKPVTQADFEAAVGRVIEATDVGWSDGASVQDRVQEPLRELAALIMRGARLDGVELSISGYDPSAAIVPSKKKKGAA
jgi:hypothetical protein